MAATARLMAVSSISSGSTPCSRPAAKMTAQMASTASARVRPKRASRFCSGVRTDSAPPSSPAMRPISVSMPVAVTTPRPRPRVTRVPFQSRLRRSARVSSGSDSASGAFSTATDSPVSADSSACSPSPASSRRSAGTPSPASSSTVSPGTSSLPGTVTAAPSRITRAVGTTSRRRAATARSARYSCTVPMIALSSTMTRMATVS
jgi:hypothetical protein